MNIICIHYYELTKISNNMNQHNNEKQELLEYLKKNLNHLC